jgi:N,N'-diacetyllegionaminate synthase
MSVLVIAEPGCTAEGSKAKMLELIDVAHACGANVYKSTWICDLPEMMRRRNFIKGTEDYARFERIYGWHVWPIEWHQEFGGRCNALGMGYAVTVHTVDAVEKAWPYAEYLKISSFEAGYGDLLAAANRHHNKVILSTGMSGMFLDLSTWDRKLTPWALLHCTSAYPAPLEALNLNAMGKGLSDHSRHLLTGAVAVGAGARIIETHYRLEDCDPQNPDYAVAFTPAEFTTYIRNVRDAETMMGTGEKQIQPCEAPMLKYKAQA